MSLPASRFCHREPGIGRRTARSTAVPTPCSARTCPDRSLRFPRSGTPPSLLLIIGHLQGAGGRERRGPGPARDRSPAFPPPAPPPPAIGAGPRPFPPAPRRPPPP